MQLTCRFAGGLAPAKFSLYTNATNVIRIRIHCIFRSAECLQTVEIEEGESNFLSNLNKDCTEEGGTRTLAYEVIVFLGSIPFVAFITVRAKSWGLTKRSAVFIAFLLCGDVMAFPSALQSGYISLWLILTIVLIFAGSFWPSIVVKIVKKQKTDSQRDSYAETRNNDKRNEQINLNDEGYSSSHQNFGIAESIAEKDHSNQAELISGELYDFEDSECIENSRLDRNEVLNEAAAVEAYHAEDLQKEELGENKADEEFEGTKVTEEATEVIEVDEEATEEPEVTKEETEVMEVAEEETEVMEVAEEETEVMEVAEEETEVMEVAEEVTEEIEVAEEETEVTEVAEEETEVTEVAEEETEVTEVAEEETEEPEITEEETEVMEVAEEETEVTEVAEEVTEEIEVAEEETEVTEVAEEETEVTEVAEEETEVTEVAEEVTEEIEVAEETTEEPEVTEEVTGEIEVTEEATEEPEVTEEETEVTEVAEEVTEEIEVTEEATEEPEVTEEEIEEPEVAEEYPEEIVASEALPEESVLVEVHTNERLDSLSLEELIDLGFNEKFAGNFTQAAVYFMHALTLEPKPDVAFYLILDCYWLWKNIGKSDYAVFRIMKYARKYSSQFSLDLQYQFEIWLKKEGLDKYLY
ncbi:hypothetical protein Desaci_3163 [Desulfosporosinus acidiphilus SJ4]|uniref:Uncharacterized protein n=1 Tax=Desulfosporosinus acidiphilus (strain DSM 22704 / JCM 16185 / SJ4) TaxID=646529 RepID=I4D8E3_DESAJ|nr:hypothetical protein [Desulfosporosinus acidiphilus]AFM42067.1 hypothetical protein Desaci_3163 [Desulfosporosinus acidiphilus SJ4]